MKNKMNGSFYPSCDSKNTSFLKGQALDGEIYINNHNLVFQRIVFFFRTKTRLVIPLNNIERVECCTLNGFLPYGVCVFTKDKKEYVLGHVQNQKLKDFIMYAKAGGVNEISDSAIKKSNIMRKVLGIIGIILAIFVIWISILVAKDFKQEDIILDELEIINNSNSSSNIDMTIKSTGDYSKVELAMKEYYQDLFANKRIFNNNRAEKLFNTFTPLYLKKNKDKLEDLKLVSMIDSKTKELNVATNKIIDMLNSDYIMSYVYKYKLDSYYNDFYHDNMVSSNDDVYQEEWRQLLDDNALKAGYLKRIVNILIDYSDKWYIENNNLYFTDDEILEEYNTLYELIYDDELNDDIPEVVM